MFLILSFHTYLFNPSEFWNHGSKLLHYFVCSSLVVRDFFLCSTLGDFTAIFYQRLLSLLIFKTKGGFSIQVSQFAAEIWQIGIHSWLVIIIVGIYILIMCGFIFKYVPVMNHGHLLAEKNSLACSLSLYLWISGCRSGLEPSSCQKCPWLSACFLNPHFWKPRLRGQISQACCVFRLETDYKQENKIHKI